MIASQFIKGIGLLIYFYPLRRAITFLPLRIAVKAGGFFGAFHFLFIPDKLKHSIQAGMETVWHGSFSERELKRLVRRNLVTRYKCLIESFFYQSMDEKGFKGIVPNIDGKEYLDEALNSKKGAVLLVSHFGSFGLLIAGLMARGYRLCQILTLSPQMHYRTWRWIERLIMKTKLSFMQHNKVDYEFWRPGIYLRSIYRRILKGEAVVLYGDGARGADFVNADFMGQPLLFPAGPFRISARAGAALIPAFIIRDADDRHRIVLEKPIMLKGEAPKDIQHGVNQYTSVLAHYVKTYPDHWFTWARLKWETKENQRKLAFTTGAANLSEFYSPQG